jgi:large subunit ribosomal protein L5
LFRLWLEFGYSNVMQVRISKISVNIGLGEALQNSKALEAAAGDMATVTGQKAVITKAKRSIAQFKLREGMPGIGVMTTLRERMWDFRTPDQHRVASAARLPGVSSDDDGRNYSLPARAAGLPEINYDKVDKIRGMR